MEVDVSNLMPEARPIVREVATVYLEHTEPWFIGLIVHGSAVKGGVIPGCSDIDFQLYLEDSAFTSQGQLPLGLGLSIYRDLSKANLSPFRYVQCTTLPSRLPEGFVGPVPGAYHLVAGRLPVAEATAQQLRESARGALVELNPVPTFVMGRLLGHGGVRMARSIRLLCTKVWPVLYQVLTLQQDDVIRVWCLSKEEAIELLPRNTPLSQTIRRFYQAVREYYPAEDAVEGALLVIESGVTFLKAAKSWRDETDL
ncbi:MAG: hypothetical protein V3T90_15255 [Anaerolineae bacterium]